MKTSTLKTTLWAAMLLFGIAFSGSAQETTSQEEISDEFNILSDTEMDIMLAFGDLVDFIGVWNPLTALIDGLTSTVSTLETTVSNLIGTVQGLEQLNPFGMILADVDGVPVMLDSQGNVLPVTVVVPPGGGSADIHQPLALISPPMVNDDFDQASAGIPDPLLDEGNMWGNLWVNPTLMNPTFLGEINGLQPAHVGLEEVDNTSDLAKPISNALHAALDQKLSKSAPPDSPNAPCEIGDVASDASFLFVCVAANEWRRVQLETDWQ